jgi:hypothetical protein
MSLTTTVAVALKADQTKLGLMVAMPTFILNNEVVIKCAIVWDDAAMRTPCPSFHSPEDLIHIGCPEIEHMYEEDVVEEDEEETTEETTEAPTADALG